MVKMQICMFQESRQPNWKWTGTQSGPGRWASTMICNVSMGRAVYLKSPGPDGQFSNGLHIFKGGS